MPCKKRLVSLIAATLFSPLVARTIAQTPAPALVDGEIQIDHNCRVLTAPKPNARDPRPHFHSNDVICHLESEHNSDHWEQTPATTPNGRPTKHIVIVMEREYVLHNVTSAPVTFVVTHSLRKGWHIDSDPKPVEVTPDGAVFRVHALPGETIRLHVGSRT
jgi:hypothetical protein